MVDYSLAHLRYFRAAARAGSFVRGAEVVHVTPPAMSKAIARLELTLDVQLFVRAKRKVALTDAGRSFLRRAERMLVEASEAEAELRGTSGALSGEFRIGAMEVFSVALLPRALAAVAKAHPELLTRSFEGSPAGGVRQDPPALWDPAHHHRAPLRTSVRGARVSRRRGLGAAVAARGTSGGSSIRGAVRGS